MNAMTDQPSCTFDPWELLGRCLGKPELAARVLQRFERQLAEDLLRLEAAIGVQDYATAGGLAHRIKGAAANVAAHGIHEQAGQLETVLRMRMDEQLSATWQSLLAERDRFEESVQSTSLLSLQAAR
uniref:Hpt domain-containing protein n=1 Tax=Schlesneria paludicola TaxID=360056 RepID=A0A7C2PA72_9PLAN